MQCAVCRGMGFKGLPCAAFSQRWYGFCHVFSLPFDRYLTAAAAIPHRSRLDWRLRRGRRCSAISGASASNTSAASSYNIHVIIEAPSHARDQHFTCTLAYLSRIAHASRSMRQGSLVAVRCWTGTVQECTVFVFSGEHNGHCPRPWSGEETVMSEHHTLKSIPTKILLPIDFSPSSQVALETAADLALHFQCRTLSCECHSVFRPSLPNMSSPGAVSIRGEDAC
jgi:hypothetical protein